MIRRSLTALLLALSTSGALAQPSAPTPALSAPAPTPALFAPTPALSAPAPALSALLFVCNQNDASVSVIDAATMKVVRVVDLTKLGFSRNAKPHHVVVEPDGAFWYVTLIGDNVIVKLDRTDRVVAKATFETPGMMSLHPTQDLLFVGRSMTAVNPPPRVGALRRSDFSIEEVDVLFPRPHAMAIEKKSGTVYTASLSVNQLAAIDPVTQRVELTDVAGPPQALMQFAVSPDDRLLAVSGELSARVILFDISDRMKPKQVADLAVEKQPFDPLFSPDGRWIVLGNKAANSVTIIDARARSIAAVVRGRGLQQPHGVAISPDSRFAYITNNNLKGTGDHALHMMVGGSEGAPAAPAGAGTVVTIDLESQRIVNVLEVGHNASGIALYQPK